MKDELSIRDEIIEAIETAEGILKGTITEVKE